MNRRDMIKTGLCVAGGAWIACSRSPVGNEENLHPAPGLRAGIRGTGRTFPMKLETAWTTGLDVRLFWLKSLLERFGKDVTLAVWEDALRPARDAWSLEKSSETRSGARRSSPTRTSPGRSGSSASRSATIPSRPTSSRRSARGATG